MHKIARFAACTILQDKDKILYKPTAKAMGIKGQMSTYTIHILELTRSILMKLEIYNYPSKTTFHAKSDFIQRRGANT